MKKIFSLFIIAIFLVSVVPFAIAAEGKGLNEERGLGIKEKVGKARGLFLEAKEKFAVKVRELKEVKAKWKGCQESEDCEKQKKEFRKHSGEYLERLSDKTLKILERIKEKVVNSSVEGDFKVDLLERVENAITSVEEIQEKFAVMSEEPTKEEVKGLAIELREILKGVRPLIKISSGKVMQSKLGNIVAKISNLEEKFEKQISELKAKGIDVSEMEDLLNKLIELNNVAGESHKLVRENFFKAFEATGDEKTELIDEAHKNQKEMKEHLKVAKDYLKKLVHLIREARENAEDN